MNNSEKVINLKTCVDIKKDVYGNVGFGEIMFIPSKLSAKFNDYSKGLKRIAMFDVGIKSITINEEKRIVTVVFEDNKVIQQKCSEEDVFDPYIGVALCIARKMYGSKNKFRKFVDSHSKKIKVKNRKE